MNSSPSHAGDFSTHPPRSGEHASENFTRPGGQQAKFLAAFAQEQPVYMTDAQERIVFWSKGMETLLGYTADEATGRTFGALSRTLPPSKKAGTVPFSAEVILCKNGRACWFSRTRKIFTDAHGEKVTVHGLLDVTEYIAREEAARLACDNKDRLLANVSHELRTPLAAVLLWTQLFEEQRLLDPAQLREGLDVIHKSTLEQREIIEDLLDIARIEQGKLRLERAPVDLVRETKNAMDVARMAAREKGVELREAIDPLIGVAEVDPHRWKQIIWNLLSNAVKFTPRNGRIALSLVRRGGNVELRVTDTGKGIPQEFLHRVFDRFHQAESSALRNQGGLGLGLNITRELVRLHSGVITVESEGVGKGATFTAIFPLPLIASAQSVSAERKNPITGKLKNLKILLVEDAIDIRTALKAVLTAAGASIFSTANAYAALQEFQINPPDILISDLGLPYVDGNELIRQIRALEKSLGRPPVPALAFTAHAGAAESRTALESGFNQFLAKPVEPVSLVDTLAGMLA